MSESGEPYPKDPRFLDETGDAMALGFGAYDGLRSVRPNAERYRAARRNKYYYAAGFWVGYALKVAGAIAGVGYGTGVLPV